MCQTKIWITCLIGDRYSRIALSQSISVTVHLHTTLQRQTPAGPVRKMQLTLPAGSTLEDVRRILEITIDPHHLLLVVNGRLAEADQMLSNGDEVHFIPAISGGDVR